MRSLINKNNIIRIIVIFLISFILNALWEKAHSLLYTSYQGGEITEMILVRAAFWDAVIITIICLPFLFLGSFRKNSWLIIILGVIISIIIELYALNTGRWEYGVYMPLIPFINIGLTPTIQLGLLGYLSFLPFIINNKKYEIQDKQ